MSLEQSSKDFSENVMIVDLVRNALGDFVDIGVDIRSRRNTWSAMR